MSPRPDPRRRRLLLATAMIGLLPGCGGVDSGGTGYEPPTLADGPISGFGSIVVAGVHYDETSAELLDADDAPLDRQSLGLGAVVRIDASAVTTGGTRREAVAHRVRVNEAVIGPVESVDAVAGTVRVLGQVVAVNGGTAFDAGIAGGIAGLAVGQVVAVHGLLDAAGARIVATRIEARPGAVHYVVRGTLAALDRSARRLAVGGLQASVADASAIPASLAVGSAVRLVLQTVPVAGIWPALKVQVQDEALPDRGTVELEGRVSAFTSPTRFSVAGVPVDATAATVTGTVALGARVEVAGRTDGGTLIAQRVQVDDDEGAGSEAIELEGTISGADVTARRFVVRGVTVLWSDTTRFDSSTAADIRDDRRVAVKGRLADDRSRVEATLIHVEL